MDGGIVDIIDSLISRIPADAGTVHAAARLAGLFVTVPLFASRLVPLRFRLALLVVLLAALWPAARLLSPASDVGEIGVASLGGELLVGVALGWLVRVILGAVQGAATLVSDQIGFSFGSVMDPLSEGGEPVLRTFHGLLAVFIFVTVDLHHAVLRGVGESFLAVPPGSAWAEGPAAVLGELAVAGGSRLFEAALCIGFPVMGMLLLVSVVQGILSRVIPELEFLVFGFPLRAFAGLGVVAVSLPFLVRVSRHLFEGGISDGRGLVGLLSG
jgi:flagellar biosynthetic protein FliR